MQKKGAVHFQSLHGGSLRNAIPREAVAVVSLLKSDWETILHTFDNCKEALLDEYSSLEENLLITIEAADNDKVLTKEDSRSMVYALLGIYNGVYRMSPAIKGLVETSNNLARIKLENGDLQIACLTRSSVKSSKTDLSSSIVAIMKLAHMETKLSGHYPGWQPNANSAMLDIAKAKYTELFDHEPRVEACHAGLECGLLGERYPGLDMISFGPNIRRAHSPDEYVEIKSVQKFWKLLLAIMKEIPKA
jgi:dipeptidase D